jgi:hypothetical protein
VAPSNLIVSLNMALPKNGLPGDMGVCYYNLRRNNKNFVFFRQIEHANVNIAFDDNVVVFDMLAFLDLVQNLAGGDFCQLCFTFRVFCHTPSPPEHSPDHLPGELPHPSPWHRPSAYVALVGGRYHLSGGAINPSVDALRLGPPGLYGKVHLHDHDSGHGNHLLRVV